MKSSILCPIPWNSVYIDADGSRRLCCASIDWPVYHSNLSDQNLPHMVETRQVMLGGEKPSVCYSCWDRESQNLVSIRKRADWGDEIITTDPHVPLYIDIKIGRVCNLACKMCHSDYSSKWLHFDKTIQRTGLPPVSPEKNHRWFDDPNNQAVIQSLLEKSVEHYGRAIFNIAGGEPMLSKSFIDFVVQLPDSLKAKTAITITTNGTTIPDVFQDALPRFSVARVCVSMEATSGINEYIRWPSDNAVIDANVQTLHSLGLSVRYQSTIQVYNILNFWEVAQNVDKYGGEVFYQTLWWPECLRPSGLPKPILDIAITRAIVASAQLVDINAKQELSGVIESLRGFEGGKGCADVLEYSSQLDEQMNLRLKDVHPELYDLMEHYR
jgi:organic radical activating enzyme